MLKSRATIVLILTLWLSAVPVLGQKPTAEKFDEFGDVLWSDLIARLDNYALQLMNQPNTMGFVVVYRTRRDLPGLSHALAMRSKEYLAMTRGLPRDRVSTVDGGIAEHLTQELWIVPPGSKLVPRAECESDTCTIPSGRGSFMNTGSYRGPNRKGLALSATRKLKQRN